MDHLYKIASPLQDSLVYTNFLDLYIIVVLILLTLYTKTPVALNFENHSERRLRDNFSRSSDLGKVEQVIHSVRTKNSR